jgi:hypothetical protein
VEQSNPSKGPHSLIGEQHLAEMILTASRTPAAGCFVEVGVYRGGSAWHLYALAQSQARALYLYDTFKGIPHKDPIDSHSVGDFADTSHAAVMALFPDAWVVKGIFPASALPMPGIAFVHLDCDQYRSVRESVVYLQPKMMRGGIMWFDDSPCLAGARQAVQELFGDRLQLSSEHGKHFVIFDNNGQR